MDAAIRADFCLWFIGWFLLSGYACLVYLGRYGPDEDFCSIGIVMLGILFFWPIVMPLLMIAAIVRFISLFILAMKREMGKRKQNG
jgi:uncharacterized membrane protein